MVNSSALSWFDKIVEIDLFLPRLQGGRFRIFGISKRSRIIILGNSVDKAYLVSNVVPMHKHLRIDLPYTDLVTIFTPFIFTNNKLYVKY